MTSNLDNNRFNELVEAVAGRGAGADRLPSITAAFEELSRTQTLHKWAMRLASQRGIRDPHTREDIESIVTEKVFRALLHVTSADVARVRDWSRHLHGQSKNAVRDYVASRALTAASGMSGVQRRATTVNIARRDLLASLQREPSQAEIIAHANTYLHESRKDPQRQGALITEADFGSASTGALSLDMYSEWGLDLADETNQMEVQVEAAFAAQNLIRECRRMFPRDARLPEVAQFWMHLHLTGERVSAIRVANATGASRKAARDLLQRLESVLDVMRSQDAA
ncbi:hypothetical protein [Rathayibacter rathayi]|uniref:Sigma-70 family RNA polymerase sigma factor n=1 Tax=Rathayibacter rathayi TaxID=33887 RepID=A0ABX5AEH6_RATRA|nr:hypothetical protein [Rathayibacter rathayi]PPF23110.1 hypothetical protein C5C34_09785 [Rathayibacter rathayi]PPF51628.1 hypothetical protein C5C08_02145 [Rathayibacter rathayi]PPF83218.1 hypothetical protein C5C14_02180 [Rathayibacter rathayi]PPG47049.1 hypothetical protein C5C20_02140 [Rathayibacter rathayi]PPG94072.1 hypothetical protein C5C22_09655 [Rathayibacter rathayi]